MPTLRTILRPTPSPLLLALFTRVAAALLLVSSSPAFAASGLPAPIQIPGVENAFHLADRVYSGGTPENDEAFAALARLGVRTIISTDGAKPDVEAAARHGIRYIHLPIGYDGISPTNALRFVKASEIAEGRMFVHCHHGKHRGPAAAALICQAAAGWTPEQAVQWMQAAGTSTNYPGLYRANREFHRPSPPDLAAVPSNLPSRAQVSGWVDAMVEIDHRWELLQAVQKAGWQTPASHPDVVPATEALLFHEAFRELHRSSRANPADRKIVPLLKKAERQASRLHQLLHNAPLPLPPSAASRANDLLQAAAASCTDCHRRHRN